ncbi:MAG: TetR/AcrR family transcriptional regulator [Dongiaceae bacterium]
MVRVWADDDPKAALMTRKRTAIVQAALRAFLQTGYAESSVNRIAASAGVSIKTLYRHFDSKDDLFVAVMLTACRDILLKKQPWPDAGAAEPSWFADPPDRAFPLMGELHLNHILSDDQVALYRVVLSDAHRFPELSRHYNETVSGRCAGTFTRYLDRWAPVMGWKIGDKRKAGAIFAALLKSGILDGVLTGYRKPDAAEIAERARQTAARLLTLLEAGQL